MNKYQIGLTHLEDRELKLVYIVEASSIQEAINEAIKIFAERQENIGVECDNMLDFAWERYGLIVRYVALESGLLLLGARWNEPKSINIRNFTDSE